MKRALQVVVVSLAALLGLLWLQPWWPAPSDGPLGPVQLPDASRYPLQRQERMLANGGTLATYRVTSPAGAATGTMPQVVLLHGTSLHAQWMAPLMHALADRGWIVNALDLPGHGHSSGTRGHLPDGAELEAMLAEVLAQLQQDAPQRPLVLVAHSLGAEFVLRPAWLRSLRERGTRVAGLVLLAPYVGGAGNERPASWRRSMWSVAPLRLLWAGRPALHTNWSLRGSDPLLVTDYDRSLLQLRRDAATARSTLRSLTLPVLYLQGHDDELFDPDATQALFTLIGATDKTLTLLPGTRHMDLIERAADPLSHWLDQHFNADADRNPIAASTLARP